MNYPNIRTDLQSINNTKGISTIPKGDFKHAAIYATGRLCVIRFFALSGEIFCTLKEAKVLIEKWRLEYNTLRPHSSLNYRPPAAPEAYLH
jgi:transposase InsO family protein